MTIKNITGEDMTKMMTYIFMYIIVSRIFCNFIQHGMVIRLLLEGWVVNITERTRG